MARETRACPLIKSIYGVGRPARLAPRPWRSVGTQARRSGRRSPATQWPRWLGFANLCALDALEDW